MKIEKNKSLKELTTFCIGGTARYFCIARNEKEILKAVCFAATKKISPFILGAGSNTLFTRKKTNRFIIKLQGGKPTIHGDEISVFAGTSLDAVVRYSLKKDFCGLECLSAIPGTIGGAVFGNAGAYGKSIGNFVSRVEVLVNKKKKILSRNACKFRYRESVFKEKKWIILRVFLRLKKGDIKKARATSRLIRKARAAKYPPHLKCPGSFFKNPLVSELKPFILRKIDSRKIVDGKIPAGYLLESVGAKGMRIGGISVANYHGNLFVNTGNATVADVLKITKELKKRVHKKFGIVLSEEVQFLQ